MISKNIAYLLGLIFCLSILACEEPINWTLEQGMNDQLVVEAILVDKLVNQEIRLSKSFDDLDGVGVKVTDAEIMVEVENLIYEFASDPADPGLYKSDIPFRVLSDLDYNLKIKWQGEDYSAQSRLSVVAPIPNITFRPIGETDSLTFQNFAPLFNANQQAMYEVDIDWAHLTNDSITSAKTYFYTFSSVDASELSPRNVETILFPKGSIVIVRKYGLNDEYAAYLKALVIETQWRGGAFYSPSASLSSNISNNALGFFSTCAVLQEILIAE